MRRPSVHTLLDRAVLQVRITALLLSLAQRSCVRFARGLPSRLSQTPLTRQDRRRRFAGKSADSPRRSVCTRPVAPVPSTTLSSRVVKKTRLFRIFGGLHYSLNLKRFMFVLGMVRTPEGESSLVTSSKLYTFFSFISILKGTERVFVYVLLYKAFIKT